MSDIGGYLKRAWKRFDDRMTAHAMGMTVAEREQWHKDGEELDCRIEALGRKLMERPRGGEWTCATDDDVRRLLTKVRTKEAEIERLRSTLDAAQNLIDEQADDPSLWFIAQHATEEYLQAALRRLHAAIEGEAPCE